MEDQEPLFPKNEPNAERDKNKKSTLDKAAYLRRIQRAIIEGTENALKRQAILRRTLRRKRRKARQR